MENSKVCPNCKNEIEKGNVVIISSAGGVPVVTWHSEEKSEKSVLGGKKSKRILIGAGYKFDDSYHCPQCRKVFCEFPTNEKE